MAIPKAELKVISSSFTDSKLNKTEFYITISVKSVFLRSPNSTGATSWNLTVEFPCEFDSQILIRFYKVTFIGFDSAIGEVTLGVAEVLRRGLQTDRIPVMKNGEVTAQVMYSLTLMVPVQQMIAPQVAIMQPVPINIEPYRYQVAVPQVVNRTLKLTDLQFLTMTYQTRDRTVEIHTCRLLPTNQPATVKICHCRNSDEFNTVQKEALIMCRMNHPNICKCYESLLDNRGGAFNHLLVMETIEGANLAREIEQRRVARRQWSEGEIRKHLEELIDAFAYMQSLDVCHSDIKPDNFMVSSQGTIKIIDFGLSLSGYQDKFQEASTYRVSGTQNFFSPLQQEAFKAYMAGTNPQCLVRHNPYKSDVYALGLVFLSISTLKYIEHLNDLARPNLGAVIESEIVSVRYGAWLHRLLTSMLVIDESSRADFLELRTLGFTR